MAKQYRATNTILHGKEGGVVVEFQKGELVTGLTAKEMASLWEAGSLEEASVATSEPERSEAEKRFEEEAKAAEAAAVRAKAEATKPAEQPPAKPAEVKQGGDD